jgi:hypothetical protein
VSSGSSTSLRDDQGAPGLLARLTAPTERATNASSPISCPAAYLSMAAATSSTNPPTGGAQGHRSGSPTQQLAHSAAFCTASRSADGVSDTTTPFRATERSTCHAEPSPNQSQLPHLNSCVTGPRWRGKSLHQARWCTTSARIGFHHFVLAAEFLQLDLFGEFPLPRRSGRLGSRTLVGG